VGELAQFDFEGLDQSRVGYHPEHGAYVQATPFLEWLGFRSPRQAIKDNLQEGDSIAGVRIRTGAGERKVTILTKRGVRRLLFRSNKPIAVKYADAVLDMLDEVDRNGMVVDERRITDDQIAQGRAKLDAIASKRLEERMDYRSILHSLKLGGAVDDEYRHVQNTLYLSLFGMTAAQIRARQPQRTGTPRKRGEGFRKSTVAKDFLTEDQLTLLGNTVLVTIAQIQQRCPNGASAGQMIDAIGRAVSLMRAPRLGAA
jgi:prophage antirepressor-like protein